MLKFFSIYFIAFISHINNSISISHREKRFLIFPRGNPTRHQFIAGFGIPIDLEPESLTIGYVFKAQYFLPYNVTQLYPSRLERDIKVDEYARAYETYTEEVESVDDANAVTDDGVRWSIYQVLEIMLRSKLKVDGKQCVLRAICEMSQLPFTFESGLLGELLHIFFVPSTTWKGAGMKNDYIYAEELGKSGVKCENGFHRCRISIMNIFSSIY